MSSVVLEPVYDPKAVEDDMYALWERAGAFASKPDGRPHDQTFTMVIPPPNVTGALHLGHALNNTLQDILIRYHRMRGFNTLWQPGTDHAGIATQAVVERRIREEEGKSRDDLGPDELLRRIWKWKDQYEARIISQLKLMGCSCDWKRTRFTLDEGMSLAVRQMFFRLFKDGLIFRGKRLVNWDTQLQTAVSDDEVYYEKVQGHFWHFKYPVIDPKPGEPEHVIIATTRPETMLGDTAVAVHPDPEAFFDREEVALKALWDKISNRSGKEGAEIQTKLEALAKRRESNLAPLVALRDMARDGRRILLPLVEREIPLIEDEWADPTKGSGCVKITPAHDPNDYEVGLRHKLPMINVLTPDGKIARIVEDDGSVNPHSGDYEGLTFTGEGRRKVIAAMKARGLLHAIEDHETEIGHSDRSKIPIEPFLSDQWFIRTRDIPDPQAPTCVSDVLLPEPQASACANTRSTTTTQLHGPTTPRTPDLAHGATLLTWTTYGSWLPGDDRGSVSRAPRKDDKQSLHNLPGEPYDNDEPQRRAEASKRLEGDPVRLSHQHATRLLACIADTCERHGVELLAVAIMTNHVHVLCQGEQHGRELLQLIKGNGARMMSLHFRLTDSPRWWTKSGSRRRIKPGADLTAAIEYVKHQTKPLCVWSFDRPSGEADETVEVARAAAHRQAESLGEVAEFGGVAQAEACGSGGIRLADGLRAPGLAQAAMDAVADGRIKVFPSRYAKSYLDWLGEKRDWCISRQLWWGHRIPIWHLTFTTFEWADRQPIGHFADRQAEKDISAIKRLFEACNQRDEVHFRKAQTTEDGSYSWYMCTSDPDDEVLTRLADLRRTLPECRPDDIEAITKAQKPFEDRFGEQAVKAASALLSRPKRVQPDEDVLDTWFSSALWPFSTLGWPEETEHLKQYYTGSVLCTSRDIITNWVARMVMFGLYATGKVPFDHVYIHPKILDGRGETMSKSKGNGVDPVDVIHTHGADALRYSMADMTTETQDIRMPVEYVCPHCGKLTHQEQALKVEAQARKSRGEKLDGRLQPADCTRVKCEHKECGRVFATRLANDALKSELGVGRETSAKFDIGRNFCNKLWNAARFAFLNLENTPCANLNMKDLLPEDRWILARLSQTIGRYHECLRHYQFSASVKELREFFWDSLCDWYIELTKPRLTESQGSARVSSSQASRASQNDGDIVRQVLAFCLDQTLRLFHPTIPFITERLWQQLNTIAPNRGFPGIAELETDSLLILAAFPPVAGYPAFDDEAVLQTFSELQAATRGVRDLRVQCNVSPKERVTVTVVVPETHLDSFKTHAHIVRHMANIGELHVTAQAERPRNAGCMALHRLRIYVHDVSDDQAERDRTRKALQGLEKQITGKQAKLGNKQFLTHARPEVVQSEQERLADLMTRQAALRQHLMELDG